jgi:anti-anti-sigma factor
VSFLASIGLRTLVMGAKAIANKGGRMVLVGPQEGVEKVLKSSSIDTIIPIYADQASALAALA